MRIRKNDTRPKILINNIIKPIKVKKNEKVIFVVGDGNNMPPTEVWNRIRKELHKVIDCKEVIISDAIKLYIVPNDCKIELYRGDKIEKVDKHEK